MTFQDIFNMLAEAESKCFYALSREPENEYLQIAHTAAKTALEAFAKASGCHN